MTSALDLAQPLLRCPVCGEPLTRADSALRCPQGHAFDVARQGFVSLFGGRRPHSGDTTEMVAARERFLGAKHYATIASAVLAAARGAPAGALLDLAGGTGWYAARVLDDDARAGVLVEASTPALRRAARAHSRLAAVGADVWGRLPVHDGVFAVALSIFGPRHADELARVLTPGGLVVVVTPSPDHLAEVRSQIGMLAVGADKQERLRDTFAGFDEVGAQHVEYRVDLDQRAVVDLAVMGPAGHHRSAEQFTAAAADLPDTVAVTVAVDVTTWRRPT